MGGVLGMQVEFISRDNQPIATEPPTPEASVSAATELIEMENVFALLGPIYSTNSVEVGPIAQQAQRLMLPGSTGSNVPAVGDYVFLISVPNPFQGKVMANFAMNPDEAWRENGRRQLTKAAMYTRLISYRRLRQLFKQSVEKSFTAVLIPLAIPILLPCLQRFMLPPLMSSSVPVFNRMSRC